MKKNFFVLALVLVFGLAVSMPSLALAKSCGLAKKAAPADTAAAKAPTEELAETETAE